MKKLSSKIAIISLLSLNVASVFAEQEISNVCHPKKIPCVKKECPVECSPICPPNSQPLQSHFTVGVQHNYTHVHFIASDSVTGYQTGALAGYRFEDEGYFVNLNFEGYWTTGHAVNEDCLFSDLTEYYTYLNFGYLFKIGTHCRLGPYIGVDYDQYKDEMSPDAHGLEYRFRKIQIPVGIQAYGYVGDYLSIGLIAEVRPDVYSKVHVAKHTFNLHKARSYRAMVPFKFNFCSPRYFSLQVIPFYDWNRFGSTTEKTSLGVKFPIPALTRWNLGLQLVADFHF